MPRPIWSSVLLGTLTLALAVGPSFGPRGLTQPADKIPENGDEKFLREAGIATDSAGLINFFHQRSLKEADRRSLEDLVHNLDSRVYREREAAKRDLIARGSLALPYLNQALKTGSLEMQRRAQECIKLIKSGPGPEQPAAAARLLAARPFKEPRQARDAIEALMDFLPAVDDEWLEEEVLNSLAALAERQEQMDLIRTALQDKAPQRRGAAGYVLAQRGPLDQRKAVRALLDDSNESVRERVATGLIGRRVLHTVRTNATADESFLRTSGVGTEPAALVEFFRKRSLDATAQQELTRLVQQLGDRSWSARERATRALIEKGPPAVPFLRVAAESEFAETALRASRCIEKIKQGPGPALPSAAARLLARASSDPDKKGASVKTSDVIATLLNYVPFADDEGVEEEVLNSLTALSIRDSRLDPLFLSGLHDALPARRGASAFVLGRSGTREDCQAVQGLLRDEVLKVRLRAAQGLVAARARAAVPALIDLLGKAPDAWAWRVEELLQRIAHGKGPDLTASAEGRKKAAGAWADWWREHESRVDLARASHEEQRLGLTLIVEYDSNIGNRQGKAWECGRDGNPRWVVKDLLGPMDAQILPGGRILVAENNVSRVSERDLATGKIIWQHNVANPVNVQRLPNGNTFIASYNFFVELDPNRRVVLNHNMSPSYFIFGARKLRNGHIVAVTSQGVLLEFNPATKQTVRTIKLGFQGNWCGVDVLPNGRYLVAMMNPGEVREIDTTGKVHWTYRLQGAFRAERLPNGNTLVVSMTQRTVSEVDRAGNRIWSKTCDGRPWVAHAR
ncbi:MAG: PQQ-binding-like beta-propeller repeat protein [Gemmataceae bacterium]|nr:PQQ-binding-like beta-propeller repeat protein [Gemmataceae bacterium]